MKIKTFRRSSAFFLAAALCLGSASGVSAMNESEFSQIIEEAKNTDISGYTPESCESLQAALAGAEALLKKEGVTEEELGAGGMMLQAILENGMVSQADKSSLETVLTEAAAYTDGTQEGYEELENARTQAAAVLSDGNATQTKTDGAAAAVAQAEENLGGGVDKSVLADLISQAEAVDTSGSDEASVNFLKAAIASASLGKQDFTGYLAKMWYYPGLTDEGTLPYAMDGAGQAVAVGGSNSGTETADAAEDLFADGSSEEAAGSAETQQSEDGQSSEDTDSTVSAQSLETDPVPAAEASTSKEVSVESYYDTYDSYNDPKKGTDAKVKGQKYPHYITISVELNQSLVWTKIYVPVMEAINAGGGRAVCKTLSGLERPETDQRYRCG